jgi:hypothetical protein
MRKRRKQTPAPRFVPSLQTLPPPGSGRRRKLQEQTEQNRREIVCGEKQCSLFVQFCHDMNDFETTTSSEISGKPISIKIISPRQRSKPNFSMTFAEDWYRMKLNAKVSVVSPFFAIGKCL